MDHLGITNEELNEMEARCEAATPGPWFFNSYSAVFSTPEVKEYDDCKYVAAVPADHGDTATGRHVDDAIFIEHARTDLPKLISELKAMRGLG